MLEILTFCTEDMSILSLIRIAVKEFINMYLMDVGIEGNFANKTI